MERSSKLLMTTVSLIKEAGPSTPVEILGLSGVPDSGAEVLVVESERKAREVADYRKTKDRETKLRKAAG